ncbi:hypothetical protein WICPIJ_004655 [Wickerhamomyces pijperi]|uniref:Uncharacterized protein n=1 Tax=Wickerhamomyces pijperi TaxID=599730 RepID=A0A9P8TMP7_WICPI|nr:hypothetical protein WICPIJ_004655 [Wickerhamomyces pijperi]
MIIPSLSHHMSLIDVNVQRRRNHTFSICGLIRNERPFRVRHCKELDKLKEGISVICNDCNEQGAWLLGVDGEEDFPLDDVDGLEDRLDKYDWFKGTFKEEREVEGGDLLTLSFKTKVVDSASLA